MAAFFISSARLALLLLLSWATGASAQTLPKGFPAAGSPPAPKLVVDWSRYYDYEEVVQLCQQMAAAHPRIVRYAPLGRSFEGRPLPALTLMDPKGPPEMERPAYYMDGNIHANEIQATEVCLYTAWYLAEMSGHNAFIDSLLRSRVFYVVPTINPDGREHFLKRPNNMHSPRSGVMPRDDDRDGLFDEDGFDDLDGDGHITQMIRLNPKGQFYFDTNEPRRLRRIEDEKKVSGPRYEVLGTEGIDGDGDGLVNEDGPGYYDPNRDWVWGWETTQFEGGAGPLPFYQPENRVIRDFIISHPNIAGAITYHNTGGMLLHGPGNVKDTAAYPHDDIALYRQIGQVGEKLLPGYKVMTTYKELYSTHGGESDWMHGARGICAWTGELFTPYLMFHQKAEGYIAHQDQTLEFDRLLLFEEAWRPWKEVEHPQYGRILVGGLSKFFSRATPGFLMPEDLHRNMAFALYHAHEMPRLAIDSIEIKAMESGLYEMTLTVRNDGLTPTHLEHDVSNQIEAPDYFIIRPKKADDVVAGMTVVDQANDKTDWPEDGRYARLAVSNIPGRGRVTVRWWLRPGSYELEVVSRKGGALRRTLRVPN